MTREPSVVGQASRCNKSVTSINANGWVKYLFNVTLFNDHCAVYSGDLERAWVGGNETIRSRAGWRSCECNTSQGCSESECSLHVERVNRQEVVQRDSQEKANDT